MKLLTNRVIWKKKKKGSILNIKQSTTMKTSIPKDLCEAILKEMLSKKKKYIYI